MVVLGVAPWFWVIIALALGLDHGSSVFKDSGSPRLSEEISEQLEADEKINLIRPSELSARGPLTLHPTTDAPLPTTSVSSNTTSASSIAGFVKLKRAAVCDPSTNFRCHSGECISKAWQCDGGPDCNDHSDEFGCNQEEEGLCPGMFECTEVLECVPSGWRCDGEEDCEDGTDELNCQKLKCAENQFQCQGGHCINRKFLCDGTRDCPKADDESSCGSSQCLTNPGHFQCGSMECVPPGKVCNRKEDCNDGSDEGQRCNETCGKGDCSHLCYQSPRGPHCDCHSGYLLKNHTKCQDIDECEGEVLACDHFCTNRPGTFTCTCHPHYTLHPDKVSCKTTMPGAGFLLVAQENGIRSLALDQSNYIQVYYSTEKVVGLAYDPLNKQVFWSTLNGIFSATLGNNVQPNHLIEGVGLAEGLVVDWLGRNLYLTCPKLKAILSCSMDGQNCHVVVYGTQHPRPIQVDLAARMMYWGDIDTSMIERAGLDGSERQVLVSGLAWPNALALDLPAGRLYYMDAKHDSAHSVKLDGSEQKNLVMARVQHPYSMAVWEQHLYWTSWKKDHILTCNKRDGRHVETLLRASPGRLYYGIMLYHPAMTQLGVWNPCTTAGCSHLCLLSPSGRGYTCACPNTVKTLSSDGHTCVADASHTSLLLSNTKEVYSVQTRLLGTSFLERWPLPTSMEGSIVLGDITYDPTNNGLVLVSDLNWRRVHAMDVATSRSHILLHSTDASFMAMDWVRHNLYWVDRKNAVEVARVEGSKVLYRRVIVENITHPAGLAVSPLLGYLFVSDASKAKAYIRRCGLDGSECVDVVDEDLNHPFSLSFDRDPAIKRLYWCDRGLGRIESIAADGTSRIVLVDTFKTRPSGRPTSLVVSGVNLKWTLENYPILFTKSKTGRAATVETLDLGIPRQADSPLRVHEIGWVVSLDQVASQPCNLNNGNCSHFCLGNSNQEKVCMCELGSRLDLNGETCSNPECDDHMFLCHTDHKCIPKFFKCDGGVDCEDGSDEEGCDDPRMECPIGHFQCESGNCITEALQCNGVEDCDDGSDEHGEKCKDHTCSNNYWRCNSGQCIPSLWLCDGEKECTDGSDELNCQTSCDSHQFSCRDGECISKDWQCDGDGDCVDGSDEENCSQTCSSEFFTCGNHLCIPTTATCDGQIDCEDGSDEAATLCPDAPAWQPFTCPNNTVPCAVNTSRHVEHCIPLTSLCNNFIDCPLGDDEDSSLCQPCPDLYYHCHHSKKCIPRKFLCDGEDDCDDGSDEDDSAFCPTAATTASPTTNPNRITGECEESHYQCEDGECVPLVQVCNEDLACQDGSDESRTCNSTCQNNGGCQHVCYKTPRGPHCSCHIGFMLAPDAKSCLDVEECAEEGTCGHMCVELRGSFHCTCLQGYSLLSDHHTCKRDLGEDWSLVAGETGLVNLSHTFHLNHKLATPNHTVATTLDSLAFDPLTDSIIFADRTRGVVGIMTKDTTRIVVVSGRSAPQGVSFDPVSRNLYFTEHFPGRQDRHQGSRVTRTVQTREGSGVVLICSLTGNCSVIHSRLDAIIPATSVAVRERRLFFCINSQLADEGEVITSNLDGSERTLVWGKKVVRCGSLAVDEAKKRVFWTDLALDTVETILWNGEGHRVVDRKHVESPMGLVLTGSWLMWANSMGPLHHLVRCSRDPPTKCNVKPFGAIATALLASPLPLLPGEDNTCDSAGCPHLCASRGAAATCMCPVGSQPDPDHPPLCSRLSTCEKNDCQSGSVCEPHSILSYVCRCPEGRYGLDCEGRLPGTDLAAAPPPSTNSSAVAAIVSVLVILVVMLVCVLVYQWHKKPPFTFWKAKNGSRAFRFVNPAFGSVRDQPIIGNGSPLSSGPPPCSRDNLRQFENPFFKHHEDSKMNTSIDSAVASATDSTSIHIGYPQDL